MKTFSRKSFQAFKKLYRRGIGERDKQICHSERRGLNAETISYDEESPTSNRPQVKTACKGAPLERSKFVKGSNTEIPQVLV